MDGLYLNHISINAFQPYRMLISIFFHTVYIFPRWLLAARRTFVKGLWFVSGYWARIRSANETSETIFMEVAVPLIYGAWFLFRTASIVVADIFTPGISITSRISIRFAIDSRPFFIRSVFCWDKLYVPKLKLAKYYMYKVSLFKYILPRL